MKKLRFLVCTTAVVISFSLNGQAALSDQLEEIVTTLASDEMKGRGFGTDEGNIAAQFIIDHFGEAGVEPFLESGYRHEFHHRMSVLNVKGNNIVGIVRGSNPELADEYIVLGAHYDHIGWEVSLGDTVVYNGADDNASGVASIIQIGRILTENREQLGRSVILIAFDGEESGLLGSKAFVRDFITAEEALIARESVVAMFSLDMVGMYSSNDGVDMGGIETLTDHAALIEASNAVASVTINKSDGNMANRTDTAPFGEAGIPSVHVFTGMESPYHKPEDDSDLLDYDGMAGIVEFMVALTREISNKPELGVSKQMEKIASKGPMKRINPGVLLNTGTTYHNIKDDYYRAKSVFSYSAGFFLETRLAQWLAIQPELLYEWGGSQIAGGTLKTHSVTVPVSLLLTTPDEGMGVRAYYKLGGYYSYAFSGNANGTALDFTTDYADTDYGIVFGFGVEVMNFRMGYHFQSSLVDFTLNDGLDTQLKGSYVMLGWAF